MAITPDQFDEKGAARKAVRQPRVPAAPPPPPPAPVLRKADPPINIQATPAARPPKDSSGRLWLLVAVIVVIVVGVVIAYWRSQPDTPHEDRSQPALIGDDSRAVHDAFDSWVQAFRSRDTSRLAASYAPTVENYAGKPNVSRESIQSELETAFARISEIQKYEVSNLRIEMLPSQARAVARFHKEWATPLTDGRTYAGAEEETLTFTNSTEGWKIIKERHSVIWKRTQ
jgi:ketosteroid isomerase-like protein